MSAGPSGTPLARKLGIRPDAVVGLLAAPPGIEELLAPLPDGVAIRRRAQGRLDVIVLFATRRAALERRFGRAVEALEDDGGLWVAWPKKSSKVPTDLDFDEAQRLGLESGLVDNKICAIDQVWTALRFVVRLADRPARRAARERAT
ncbi:MAG TPA: DUF3052 domain-containing protein [Actinomycetes bacterium]